jgi:hypothetical protein
MEEGNDRLDSGSSLRRAATGKMELVGFGAISFNPVGYWSVDASLGAVGVPSNGRLSRGVGGGCAGMPRCCHRLGGDLG